MHTGRTIFSKNTYFLNLIVFFAFQSIWGHRSVVPIHVYNKITIIMRFIISFIITDAESDWSRGIFAALWAALISNE